MGKRYNVAAVGECLVDVIADTADGTSVTMTGNAGGAPVNVLAALSRLGKKTAFLGKLSRDAFGAYLKRVLEDNGIDVSGAVYTDLPTTLAMVALDEHGDRSFSFYRKNTADVEYSEEEINRDVIDDGEILHFGTVSMTCEPSRSATLAAVKYAKERGLKISFDPNLRMNLWDSPDEPKKWMRAGLEFADYVKLSDDELFYLTGETDCALGGEKLVQEYGMDFLLITMGAKGCMGFCGGISAYEPTYDTACVDTTGAGDACWGAALSRISEMSGDVKDADEKKLREILKFSNAAGSLCASKRGAVNSMASEEEIISCMENVPRLIMKD